MLALGILTNLQHQSLHQSPPYPLCAKVSRVLVFIVGAIRLLAVATLVFYPLYRILFLYSDFNF